MISQNKRLIIAANHRQARFIESHGILVKNLVLELHNEHEGTLELNRHSSSYTRQSGPHSSLDHHTPPKTIEKEDFAHKISLSLKNTLDNHTHYKEIILIAEPKMLGLLRAQLKHSHPHLPIYKDLSIDPAHMDLQTIEEKVFA